MSEHPDGSAYPGRPEQPDGRLDRFLGALDELQGQPPPAPFAPAEAVRRRGRQRAQRRVASAGVAVAVVVGLGAGGIAVLREPAAAPPPAAGPASTVDATGSPAPSPATGAPERIPVGWLLVREDLGPGDWVRGWEPERFASEPPWTWGELCPEYRGRIIGSLWLRQDLRTVAWTDGDWPGELGSAEPVAWVDQVVELFSAGGGAANLNDVRAVLERCNAMPGSLAEPGEESSADYLVSDSGFAGDEALLVEERFGATVSLTAVVRVGDAVTTIRSYDPESGRAGRERLLAIAQRAADRLYS